MTNVLRAGFATAFVMAATPALAAPQEPASPAAAPGVQQPPLPGAAVPPVPAAPTAEVARTFTGACGLLLHPVRPDRVQDFESFLAYLRDALARSANPRVRSQAAGWRFLKAAESGPNGVALYVFVIDPAVPSADYSLGPILAEVYTDPAQLAEIWALYTGSVTSGGTLLNFSAVDVKPPAPILAPPVNPPAASQTPDAAATPVTPPSSAPAAAAKPVTPSASAGC